MLLYDLVLYLLKMTKGPNESQHAEQQRILNYTI